MPPNILAKPRIQPQFATDTVRVGEYAGGIKYGVEAD
jgi:hypothetical protein